MLDRLNSLINNVRFLVVKALLRKVDDTTKIQLLEIDGLDGQVDLDVERIQQYGLTSNPPVGSEVVTIGAERDQLLAINVDRSADRPNGLSPGEVYVWSVNGHQLKLQSDGTYRFNLGTYGVARQGHSVTGNIVTDPAFWAFLNLVATTLNALTGSAAHVAPTSLTTTISEGSTDVFID